MTMFPLILLAVLYGLLVVVRAMRFPTRTVSDFELQRRIKAHDAQAIAMQHRDSLRQEMMTIHRLFEFLLILGVGWLAVATWGWLLGGLGAVTLVLLLGILSQYRPVVTMARRLCWPRHEKALLLLAKRYPSLIRLFAGLANESPRHHTRVYSREELLAIVKEADGILSVHEKQLLEKAFAFSQRSVREIMTPRKEIVAINKDEILGPLTLTALHKTGHSHLPVVYGGLDRIIGILPAKEYMNTEHQGELKVEDVMQRQIFYLNEQQTLEEALQALLRTKAHLFIVVDNNEKTVGIITISDVIAALFGQTRHGHYQQYEDVHAVAKLGAADRHTSTDTK